MKQTFTALLSMEAERVFGFSVFLMENKENQHAFSNRLLYMARILLGETTFWRQRSSDGEMAIALLYLSGVDSRFYSELKALSLKNIPEATWMTLQRALDADSDDRATPWDIAALRFLENGVHEGKISAHAYTRALRLLGNMNLKDIDSFTWEQPLRLCKEHPEFLEHVLSRLNPNERIWRRTSPYWDFFPLLYKDETLKGRLPNVFDESGELLQEVFDVLSCRDVTVGSIPRGFLNELDKRDPE